MSTQLLTTLDTAELPGVGIHLGVPAAEYHAWWAVSNSRLTTFKRSPAHLRWELEHPREQTDAMRLGTAAHTAVLEPHLFSHTYTVAEQCSATTKAGCQCSKGGSVRCDGRWFCGQHVPAGASADEITVLSLEEREQCAGMWASVHAHPTAAPLLALPGEVEASPVWEVADSLACKARIDKLCQQHGVVLDLKTTKDASPQGFQRTVFARGYHRQAAFYLDGLAALGVTVNDFVFIAVEKTAPYAVGVYRLTDEAVEAGRRELAALLARFREYLRRDYWPGYGDGILDISLPAWAWGQLETLED